MFAEVVNVEAALREFQQAWEKLSSLGVNPAFIARGDPVPRQNKKRILRALSSVITFAVSVHDALNSDKQMIYGWACDQYARTIDHELLGFWRAVSELLPGLLAKEVHERISFIRSELMKLDNTFGCERLCGLRQISDKDELWAAGWLWDLHPFFIDTIDIVDCGVAQHLFEGNAASVAEVEWVQQDLRALSSRLGETFDALLSAGDDAVLAMSGHRRRRKIPFDIGYGLREFMLPARRRSGLPAKKIRSLLEWSVDYWEDRIDTFLGPEEYGDVSRWAWDETHAFLASDDTWQIMGSVFFRPKQWVDNAKALQPVITTSTLPFEIRRRTKEIFDSFVVGNYVSVLLLCRGVLEYALIDKGEDIGIAIYSGKARKARDIRKLSLLVEDAAKRRPALAGPMESIKEKGDTFAHPRRRKGEVSEEEIDILRKQALETLGHLKGFLEGIYGASAGGAA